MDCSHFMDEDVEAKREVKEFAPGHPTRIKSPESVTGASKNSMTSVMAPVFQVRILKVWGGGVVGNLPKAKWRHWDLAPVI